MPTIKKLLSLVIVIMVFVLGSSAKASELDSQMKKLVSKISDSATLQRISTNTVLAVFPFYVDRTLSRKRVDIAVGEALTYQLLRARIFQLVERNRLNDVMEEQKLGVSGAVDSATAAKIGKLLGAKLLALGNATQIGNFYQISIKLVDTESAGIIVSEIVEVPIKIFDEDAKHHMVVLPESQVISFYIAKGYAPIVVKKFSPTPVYVFGGTIIPRNPKADLEYTGVGVKYFFLSKWMMDAAYMPYVKFGGNKNIVTVVGPNNDEHNLVGNLNGGSLARLSLKRVLSLSNRFRVQAGVGIMRLEAIPKEDEIHQIINMAGCTEQMEIIWGGKVLTSPFVQMGVEWKPQTRVGLGISGIYNTGGKSLNWSVIRGPGSYSENPTVYQFAFPKIIIEMTAAFYF